MNNLRHHVERLATVPRPPGSPAHAQAQAYITGALQDAGFVVRAEQTGQGSAVCTNLLTDPLPADPRLPLFIVGAHYDSVTMSPGADDNASAVAALIELARWVRPKLDATGLAARLQLVAYDLEESGLIGSATHARQLTADAAPVLGMISLEMLGFIDPRPGGQRLPSALACLYPDTGDFIGVIANDRSTELLRTVVAAMQTVPGLPVQHLVIPNDGRPLPDTRRSDHASFWDHGLPALMITDTSFLRNPHYHQPTDTPETLDYAFLAKVTQAACAAVSAVLRAV